MKPIELSKPARAEAVASLRRYFDENLADNLSAPLGELPAGLLLNFILEEIGPAVYNRAIADVQTRLEQRVADLGSELYAEEFTYWPRLEAKRKARR
ncbi:MAG TPA: DUF2164 domain-containing protein [Terracidiphilus sp.]|nr:DUF2164 domain-containing protein [Terracidiphilus sp.]